MSTPFQKKLATISQQQFDKYRWIRENQEPLSSQIKTYWTDIGFPFPGVGEAWSAVFVSWCVQQAGATRAQFRFATRHSEFVYDAIANHSKGIGVFHGRNPNDYPPKVGDILQNNRLNNSFDFQYAATHKRYASHSAIVMEVGVDNKGRYLRTIGGNESDSVGMKEVRLNNAGMVVNSAGTYIAVIESLL